MAKTLEQLKTDLMKASEQETILNGRVEKCMSSSTVKNRFDDYAALVNAVMRLPATTLGRKLLDNAESARKAYVVVQSNADGFTQRYDQLPFLLTQVVNGLAPGRAEFGVDFSKELDDVKVYATVLLNDANGWKPKVDEARGLMNEYRQAIKAKLAIQREIDALVAKTPAHAQGEHGNVATQNRFNRYSRIGRFGRVAPGQPPDLASAGPAWGGRFGFFYGPGGLDGAKNAADVVQKLALQYDYFWDAKNKVFKDITGIEFEVSVSFDGEHGVVSPPASPQGWADLLGRLQDTNHKPGQAASGGGGAERVLRGPVLESVRVVKLTLYPGVAGSLDKHVQAELDKKVLDNNRRKETAARDDVERLAQKNWGQAAVAAKALEFKISRNEEAFHVLETKAQAPNTSVTHAGLAAAKKAWQDAVQELEGLFFKVHGRHDPVLQKQLTAIELTTVDRALAKAGSKEEREFLEKQKKQLLKERDLKTAKDANGRKHEGVLIQPHGAQEVVSVGNKVSGFEEYSAYVRTEDVRQFAGPHAEAKRTVQVGGTHLEYAVKVDQGATAKGANKEAVQSVAVRVEAGGLAGVMADAKAARAEAETRTGKVGHDAAKRLPASAGYEPFPNIIGNLVENSVGRLFGRTAMLVHHADAKGAKQATVSGPRPVRLAATGTGGADAFAAVDFSSVMRKPRGEAMANDIARLRQIRGMETKLTSQFDRLQLAAEQARPLISPQAASLQAAVARLDAQLAGLKGARGEDLSNGARDVGRTLGEMASIARKMGYQSAGTVKAIQKAVDSRRDQLARLASGLSPEGKASTLDHARLDQLGHDVPGLSKVIGDKTSRNARGRGAAANGEPAEQGRKGRGGSWGGAPRGGLRGVGGRGRGRGAPVPAAVFERVAESARRGDKMSLVDAVAPGALTRFNAMSRKAHGLFEALRARGHKPRLKSWFSSVTGGIASIAKKVVQATPLAAVVRGAASVAGGLAKAVASSPVANALAGAVKAGVSGVGSLAKAVARTELSLVKKTARALGAGMRKVGSAIGEAATTAWDSTKQAVSAVAQPIVGAAAKTGGFYKSLLGAATGVVGAIGGKIKTGISSATTWVGDKAKKVGGALLSAAKATGKAYLDYTPMGRLMKFGWDKFGKQAWDKTKSFASVAWDATRKVGKVAGKFISSPAGQLLVNGLSMAASFVPGGLLLKAGIGAVMGGIEAYANGGNWKQILAGAAVGGVEGALPFLKIGGLGKVLIGGAKGALGAAVSGDFSLKGMGKGALNGAWDETGGKFGIGGKAFLGAAKGAFGTAFNGDLSLKGLAKGAAGGAWDRAGGEFVNKFGGGKGAGLFGDFMAGKGSGKGVLGKLQRAAQKGGLQKIYSAGSKLVPKVVKGAVWLYDKTGKAHGMLEKVQLGGDALQLGLSGLNDLAQRGAGRLGEDSRLGHLVKKVGDASRWGSDKLGEGLEYVKKVDDVVTIAHDVLGDGLESAGIDPAKAVSKMRAQQRRQRKHGGKQDVFDRIDNGMHGANRKFHQHTAGGRRRASTAQTSLLERARDQRGKVNSKFTSKLLKGGEKLVAAGVWAHGQLAALNEAMAQLVENGEAIQGALQNAVLLAEGADPGALGGSLAWINQTALEWEGKVEGGLDFVKKIQGYTGQGQELLDRGLSGTGVSYERLEESEKNAGVYYGSEEAEDGRRTVAGKPWARAGDDEQVVAPWVKWREAGAPRHGGRGTHAPKATRTLEHLREWREHVRKGAQVARKDAPEQLDKDEATQAGLGKFNAGARLMGGVPAGDLEQDGEGYSQRHGARGRPGEAVAQPELLHGAGDAAAPEGGAHGGAPHHPSARHDAAQGKKAPPAVGNLDKQLEEHLGRKFEDKAAVHAKEVESAETQTSHQTHGAEAKARTAAETEEVARGAQEKGQETPEHGLAGTVDHDGVAGGDAAAVAGLPLAVGLGEGAGPKPESDIVFAGARYYLDAFDERVNADLPRLEALLVADPEGSQALFDGLVEEGRLAEMELERVGLIVGEDPFLSRGLGHFAGRLASIRARIRPSGGAKPEDGEAAGEGGHGGADAALDQELVAGGGEGSGAEPRHTETQGHQVPGADGGDVPYLGEAHDDTWIGSGAAARPIEDGLETNFHYEDKDAGQPTVAGELGKLGGALMGLGQSVQGAAGDVSGIAEEVGGAASAVKGMGAEVGELVGHRENAVTRGADAVNGFSEWLKKGAGVVGDKAGLVEKYGKKTHDLGAGWQSKGLGKAVGQLFRKSRGGGDDSGAAPVVNASGYADAPQRLDYGVMSGMERFIGSRFTDVKIHTGKGAELITKRFDAEAVTIREHIFFAPGRFSPHSTDGRKLLAHELTHVAQRGRANLDTRTAEEEAHRAEASFGSPGMEVLDLSQPQPDFHVNMAGADRGPAGGPRTAKKERSISGASNAADEPYIGEELLDRVGEKVYELLVDDLDKEFESR